MLRCYFVCTYIYIFIATALDESVIFDVHHFPMKTLRSHLTISHAYGRCDVIASQWCCLSTLLLLISTLNVSKKPSQTLKQPNGFHQPVKAKNLNFNP